MRLTIVGLAIGFIASLATGRLMSGLLYGVSPTDPITYLAVAVSLILVALIACAVPMLRALRLDPAGVLRHG
jgi:ABC-type antimicrobial peptide transport system permease subunit